MARKLGYGGLSNTNGARDFSGKGAAPAPADDGRSRILITGARGGGG